MPSFPSWARLPPESPRYPISPAPPQAPTVGWLQAASGLLGTILSVEWGTSVSQGCPLMGPSSLLTDTPAHDPPLGVFSRPGGLGLQPEGWMLMPGPSTAALSQRAQRRGSQTDSTCPSCQLGPVVTSGRLISGAWREPADGVAGRWGTGRPPHGWPPALRINGTPITGLRGKRRLPEARAQREAVSQPPGLQASPELVRLDYVPGLQKHRPRLATSPC